MDDLFKKWATVHIFPIFYQIQKKISHKFQIGLETRGSVFTDDIAYLEPHNRHRNVVPFYFQKPNLSEDAFISPNCTIIGNVYVDQYSSVWYGCTLDGQHRPIYLGKNVSIGEKSVLKNGTAMAQGLCDSVIIGDNTTVGSNTVLISCALDSHVRVGNNSMV